LLAFLDCLLCGLVALYGLVADDLHRFVIVLTSALTIRRLAGGNVDFDHKNAFGAQRGARGATGRNTQMTLRPY
jgi:hypothetical protein